MLYEVITGYHFLQLIERRGEYVNCRHILAIIKVDPNDLYSAKLKLDTVITSYSIHYTKLYDQSIKPEVPFFLL